MSVVLSEKMSRLVKPRSFAAPRAASIARASAIRGEATKPCTSDPSIGCVSAAPVKFQARPAVFRALSQAASVLRVVDLLRSGIDVRLS